LTVEPGRRGAPGPSGLASAIAYAVLGTVLVVTRLVGLDRGLWHDEILTVRYFVREGPREILTGFYIPNDHELFSLLAWATTSVLGESEIALRAWSVLPFLAGVALVTGWLHRRVGALTAVLYLFFVTVSPLLLDLSRTARGYGLAFLAMSVLLVAAFEADRSGSGWALSGVFVAGFVGTATLPNFGVAYVATAGVLLLNRRLRSRTALGLAVSLGAILLWYLPHLDDLLTSSEQQYGGRIGWFAPTSPVDQIVLPALLWLDGKWIEPSLRWLPLIVLVGLVLLWSPLLRGRSGLLLGSGVVATLLVVWVARLYLSPRFVSYLLVPLFILAASGAAHVLGRRPKGLGVLQVAVVVGVLALAAFQFVPAAVSVTTLPREAHRDAVALIRTTVDRSTPVYTNTFRPADLEFYLGRPVRPVSTPDEVRDLCRRDETVVLVEQPYGVALLDLPCAGRAGVRRYRFEQYAEGEEITVWLVPPRTRPAAAP
jgi:hypothetical protein